MKRLLPLVLVTLLPLAAAGAQPLDLPAGQTVAGRFDGSDPTLSDGSHFRIYRYRGTPGERIAVVMRSPDFDAFLAGGTFEDGHFRSMVRDDDGAGGTDARIEAVVGADGAYYVRANTLMAGETGAYTLRVEPVDPDGASPAAGGSADEIREISLGETVRGRLTQESPVLEDETHFHLYLYRGAPGQRIVVTLRSSDFDAYLAGGGMEGGVPRIGDRDDDGAGGTDARLRVRVGAGGEYYITVNTVFPGETGEYALTVEAAGAGR